MKFFATAALILAVQAACEADGDNVCAEAATTCLKRDTTDVANVKASDYKNALKKDDTLKKGGVAYLCTPTADVNGLIENNGLKDKKTTITFTYTALYAAATERPGSGSGAFMMKSSFVAAALCLISYM